MIVDISKKSVKKIRELIVFTAFLVVALWKFNVVLDVLKAIWGIVFPFVLGGAIAFVTNVPMSFLEKKIFGRAKKEDKIVEKLARPISLFLTIRICGWRDCTGDVWCDSAAYADNGKPDDEYH